MDDATIDDDHDHSDHAASAAFDEAGQTTAEYALVILGAAAVAALLIAWAGKSHAIGKLFDEVIGKVLPG
ncbi:MAG TPA: DUF4244 domain-containing protein [Acidimicrobiia bacterium]